MSEGKMQAAKELINEKRYEEARLVLKTVDSDTSRLWLRRLDEIAPSIAYQTLVRTLLFDTEDNNLDQSRETIGNFLNDGWVISACTGGLAAYSNYRGDIDVESSRSNLNLEIDGTDEHFMIFMLFTKRVSISDKPRGTLHGN